MKQWVIKNVSGSFVSVHLEDRTVAFPPGAVKPVRALCKKADGSADVEAVQSNASVLAHCSAGVLKLFEQEFVPKKGNVGPLYNEDDPEPVRVEKILAHRLKVKEAAARAHAKPAPALRKGREKHEKPEKD